MNYERKWHVSRLSEKRLSGIIFVGVLKLNFCSIFTPTKQLKNHKILSRIGKYINFLTSPFDHQ